MIINLNAFILTHIHKQSLNFSPHKNCTLQPISCKNDKFKTIDMHKKQLIVFPCKYVASNTLNCKTECNQRFNNFSGQCLYYASPPMAAAILLLKHNNSALKHKQIFDNPWPY